MTLLRKWARRFKGYFQHKALVLMYHRVANLPSDPWQLAVQPACFEQHLQVLRKRFHVIAVNDLVEQIRDGYVASNCVCITFDDGYSDNFFNAKPLLEKYQCPATFFIPTRFINRYHLFWWDQLQVALLDAELLPPIFSMVIDNRLIEYALEEDAILNETVRQKHQVWIAPDDPPTKRCELYLILWRCLKPLPDAQLQLTLNRIRSWTGELNNLDHFNVPMSTFQLNDLVSNRLFDAGLHTVTHVSLPSHSAETQAREIVDNRLALLDVGDHARNILAYPYGDYDDTTLAVVQKEKLAAAFTTSEKAVTRRSDPFRLGRFQIINWNGEDFERQLLHWFKTR
ncbi:polysaccharide deacetylase family protein [Puia sp.]|jgi:peptidoglycan/xylan/chitin deacetylase (PgdA/CDA1 family)|uniref:polysaccharide deacetylase family protein n=1 Tax=Puia sp. TaxID=2045100 RepID=UPI002F427EE3